MTGIEVEEMDENDEKAKEAEKVANDILKPAIAALRVKNKFGTKSKPRRRSSLYTLDETPKKSMETRNPSKLETLGEAAIAFIRKGSKRRGSSVM